MLPQFGMTEFLMLAVAALIIVGPKDLPLMMRRLGQFVARGRAMAREFQSAFDDIARQAELDELRKEIEDLKRDNAVTQAADDLRAVEGDINASVMRQAGEPTEAIGAQADPSQGEASKEDAPHEPGAVENASPSSPRGDTPG
jgi:sec-independent protein translocase protein TatB